YRARREIDELIARLVQAAPDFDFVTEDEVGHAFWSVPTSETVQLVWLFREVPALYVADGHHRSAAASRARAARAQPETGAGGWARFLAGIFPARQKQLRDHNRRGKHLDG